MKNKKIIISLILCIIVISFFIVFNYDKPVLEEEKQETSFNTELALILVDEKGNETTTTDYPSSSEYYLDFKKSSCENGSLIGWDKESDKVRVTSTKADSCKLYFQKGSGAVNLKEDVLASNTLVTTAPSFSAPATDTNTNIYQTEDDFGDSYYFRGATTNNYVKFGTYPENRTFSTFDGDVTVSKGDSMYWRIVRINGDGTVRMIYAGTSAVENGVKNNSGIYYEEFENHIVDWYDDNLKEVYDKYVESAIFCEDKEIVDYTYNDSYGNSVDPTTTENYYTNKIFAPTQRVDNSDPQLTCKSKFIINNKSGYINIDEVMMAGGSASQENTSYYLYDGFDYWTYSPLYHDGYMNSDFYYIVNGNGKLYSSGATIGLKSNHRPVINLRADLLFTGEGTKTEPYVIAGFEE